MSKSLTNKEIAENMAIILRIPVSKALQIVRVILDLTVKSIRKHKKVRIRKFGRFLLYKQKRVYRFTSAEGIANEFAAPKRWKCSFRASIVLERLINPERKDTFAESYPYHLRNKVLRLRKKGLVAKANKYEKRLRLWLADKPRTTQWIRSHGGLPWEMR